MTAPAEFWASATDATSNDFASLAEDIAGVGYWKLDVASGAIKWSKGLFRIYGLPESLQPDLKSAMDAVHPDDIESAYDSLNTAICEGRDYSSQARVKRGDGVWRILENQTVCQRDKFGTVVTVLGTVLDITETKFLSGAPEIEDSRYRMLAENATEIILELTTEGIITFITPSCRRVLGYEPQDVIGHRSIEFTHPADAKSVIKSITDLVAAGPGATTSVVPIRRSAQERSLGVARRAAENQFRSQTKLPVSVQDVLRDVSAWCETEQRLKESEERYRLLAEQTKDIIVRCQPTARCCMFLPAVSHWATSPKSSSARSANLSRHSEDRESPPPTAGNCVSNRTASRARARTSDPRQNGEWVWLQGNPTVIRDEQGVAREFLNVLRDVTERRNQQIALAAAKVAAEAATAAKSEFLANMSHELRTPLTSIIGFSQLLKSQPELSAQSSRFVDSLAQASEALLGIVNDVLDFSKLEAGQIEIRREPGSPGRIATEVVQLFAPQADAKGVGLDLKIAALPDKVFIDAARLRQILLNLVGNAVKFTEKGSVGLRAGFTDGHLLFEVQDTGPGIPDDQLDKLFKRFSQVDGTSRRTHGGTGLGLAICKGLVDAMGGSIGVRSWPGRGSTFSVRIPASAVATSPAASNEIPPTGGLDSIRILVADDNRANRTLIAAMLEPSGVRLTLASTGREAVELATSQVFDVILMDLHMPEMDGYEAARSIRGGAGPNAGAPIFAFTADLMLRPDHADADTIFCGIVQKPVMPQALLAAIAGVTKTTPDACRPAELTERLTPGFLISAPSCPQPVDDLVVASGSIGRLSTTHERRQPARPGKFASCLAHLSLQR